MISTRGRYALRVMVDLAINTVNTNEYVPLEQISMRQDISKKYLELILKTLVSENLLKGHRGKGGGYRLTKAPRDYTVFEILEPTEGSMAVVECLKEDSEPCPRKEICTTLPMWTRFNRLVENYFTGITLEDLMREAWGQSGNTPHDLP